MTEDKKRSGDTQYSLEELNQQFISNIKKKKKKKHKGVFGIGMLVLLAAVVLIVAAVIFKIKTQTQSTGGNTENVTAGDTADKTTETEAEAEIYNESILSEEEQEKWASTGLDEDNIYVELNSKIYLEESKAYLRLINPIYSTYYYSITIYPQGEEETILYQSEKIAPGTILEAVMLTAEPSEKQYAAVVKYYVYDGEGNELGSHPVNAEFTTEEQYK